MKAKKDSISISVTKKRKAKKSKKRPKKAKAEVVNLAEAREKVEIERYRKCLTEVRDRIEKELSLFKNVVGDMFAVNPNIHPVKFDSLEHWRQSAQAAIININKDLNTIQETLGDEDGGSNDSSNVGVG